MRRWTRRWSGCRTRSTAVRGSFMGTDRTLVRIRMAVAIAALLALAPPAGAQERVVNFYNWSNYVAPGVLEDFTRETGIKVVYDTFDANETLETRLLRGKSGNDGGG